MRVSVFHLCLLMFTIALCCGCSVSSTAPEPAALEQPSGELPALGQLDATHTAAFIEGQYIPVVFPTWEQYTSVDGADLHFTPPAGELGYAIYRVEPPWGVLQSVHATGSDPLWLAVADFGAGRWVFSEFLEDETADLDLTKLLNPYSPEGYLYTAVICNGSDEGWLRSLSIIFDNLAEELSDWGLTATADDSGITLNWNELPVDGYIVLRSVLAEDAAPYEVGRVDELHSGGNSFSESVPQDGSGRWVPENRDNGTPEDPADDFPALAPAVQYHYRLIPVLHGARGPESPEASATVGWGERRTERRAWPDTTNQTLMFGAWIDGTLLTDAQRDWCANNLVGAVNLQLADVDYIRGSNPDFIALNDSYALMTSAYAQSGFMRTIHDPDLDTNFWPQYYGFETDRDGAYPYLDRHEDWFIHDPDSTLPGQRVEAWSEQYWLDLDSAYSQYSGASQLERLGEDCSDGWIAYGCTSLMAYSELFWQPGAAKLYDYLLPRVDSYLATVSASFAEHPLQPYLIADAWIGIDNMADGEQPAYPTLDYSATDGVISRFIEGYQPDDTGANDIWGFTTYLAPNIFTWQQAGQAVILIDDNVLYPTYAGEAQFMAAYCCYLLLRNDKTYYYYTNCRVGEALPYWYPVYSWDSGAPLDAQPQSMEDLQVVEDGYPGLYWERRFENGTVLVIPDGATAYEDPALGVDYEWLYCEGGGLVAPDGSVSGTTEWLPCEGGLHPGYSINGPTVKIIREKP